jgi:hypothetical protein
MQGEFVWHRHEKEDELFLARRVRALFRMGEEAGGRRVSIVPAGVEHGWLPLRDP